MRGLKKTQKSSENDQLELFFPELFFFLFFLISPEKTVKRKVNTKGRLHDKSLKITLSLNSRLTAVDCIKSGLTSLRLTLSLNSRLLAVDCILKEV